MQTLISIAGAALLVVGIPITVAGWCVWRAGARLLHGIRLDEPERDGTI